MSDILELDNKPEGYYDQARSELLEFVPKNITKILEVGCGNGRFAKALKDMLGVEVWGVEANKEAAGEASLKLDRVIVDNIENDNLSLPAEYFDCIIFNDVLEHLHNPWVVLEKMKQCLKKGGFVLASIPNIRHFYILKDLLVYKKWNYVDSGVLDITHLRFFTKDNIKEMFENSGYEIVKIEGINAKRLGWKYKILNALFLNHLDDMKFLQFACLARKNG